MFVDKSVFVAFLAREAEARYRKAKALFEEAEAGRLRLETTELVVAELARELEASFAMGREKTAEVLDAILETRNLKVANRPVLRKAVELYRAGEAGFPEACNIAYMRAKGRSRIATLSPAAYRKAKELEVL